MNFNMKSINARPHPLIDQFSRAHGHTGQTIKLADGRWVRPDGSFAILSADGLVAYQPSSNRLDLVKLLITFNEKLLDYANEQYVVMEGLIANPVAEIRGGWTWNVHWLGPVTATVDPLTGVPTPRTLAVELGKIVFRTQRKLSRLLKEREEHPDTKKEQLRQGWQQYAQSHRQPWVNPFAPGASYATVMPQDHAHMDKEQSTFGQEQATPAGAELPAYARVHRKPQPVPAHVQSVTTTTTEGV